MAPPGEAQNPSLGWTKAGEEASIPPRAQQFWWVFHSGELKGKFKWKWKAVKCTFAGTEIKARRVQSSRSSSLHFPVLKHPALVHWAWVQCSDSRGINLHTLSKSSRQESRIVSCSVMWNAEGSSSRTSPLPECRISTSTTGVISAPYPGLNPQGLKNRNATHSLGSFTYNTPKKGFHSGRNSCNSIKLSEDIKCCPLTLWAEPKLAVWLITRILDIICSTARAFHSQSSTSVDCTHQWDSALSQNIVFSPHRLQQWEMVPWLFPELFCSEHGRDDQSRAGGDHEAHWTPHFWTRLWIRRKSTKH